MAWVRTAGLLLLAQMVVLLGASRAAAEPLDDSGPGDTAWALPGIARVGVAGTGAPRVAVAATGGYGYTEALGSQDGPNHRLTGVVAVAAAPLPWLEAGLRLDGRYNAHPDDDLGSDDNMIGDPRLGVRAGSRLGRALYLGAELVLWVPGKDAPSLPVKASTVDARALLAYHPEGSGFTLAALGGWRLDNSAEAGADPRTLRLGDRISLGLSDFDALLLGLGASQRFGQVELLGELSADLLMGSDAPPAGQSPLRATAGARYHLSAAWQLEGLADISLCERPGLGVDDPLVPIDPRASVLLGLRYRLQVAQPPAKAAPPQPPPPAAPKPEAKPEAKPAPPKVSTGQVTGIVTDEGGHPISGAYVTVTAGDASEEVETDETGRFTMQQVVAGEAQVAVEAEGYERAKQQLQVKADATAEVKLVLLPALPAGQLRGLVRSFAGRPLRAAVRVEPGGIEVETDPEGRFELDVSPGRYTVSIEAEGHLRQQRAVKVENRGVTVINVDLRERR
jgi:hypothetical protein